ncbi:MAG: hypothetical protein V4598_12380 [Bdellovibrionota bacterium]
MKYFLITALLYSSVSWSQDLTPEQQKALLNEVQGLKDRVNKLEKKDSGTGFKTTDYKSSTTEDNTLKPSSGEPAMTAEQRAEILKTVEQYKKAQAESEQALKELDEEAE